MRPFLRFGSLCLSLLLATTALAAGGGYTPIKRVLKTGAQDPGPASVAVIAGVAHMNAAEFPTVRGRPAPDETG
jgi:hypothetical protein